MKPTLKVSPRSDELVSLRNRKNVLLRRRPSDESNREAEQLVREMTAYRRELENPELADAVMAMEIELFEHFPGIDPDVQS